MVFQCLTPAHKVSETGWPRSACIFMLPLRSRRNAIHMCTLEKVYFNWEELKWLQICEFLIEIIFILFLNTTLFYNFMLPVNRYLAMNTFRRSMTYCQKWHSLPLKGLRPLIYRHPVTLFTRDVDWHKLVTDLFCDFVSKMSSNWKISVT